MEESQICELEKIIINDNKSINFLLKKLNIVNDLLDIKVKKLEYAYNLISTLTSILEKNVSNIDLDYRKATIIELVGRIQRDEIVTSDIVSENRKFLSNKFSHQIPLVEIENDVDYFHRGDWKSGGKSDCKSDCKSDGKSGGKSDCKSGGKSGGKSDCKSDGKSGGKSDCKSGDGSVAKNDDLPELIDIEQSFTERYIISNEKKVTCPFKINRRRSRSANVIRKQYPGDINISEDDDLLEDLELINNNNKILHC